MKELKGISQNIIMDQESYRQKLESDYRNRVLALENSFQEKQHDLSNKEAILEERSKKIDDRASLHVRRTIREKLLNSIKERYTSFKLSKDTNSLRSPVNLLLIIMITSLGIIFLVSVMISFGLISTQVDSNSGSFLIKQLLFGLAFGSTIVFYFRWHKSWAEQHANEEFQLKKLELDFERASWLVEIVSEWAETSKGQFPPELLGRLSDRMFETVPGTAQEALHPGEQIANALFGASSKLKLNLGNGNQMEVDRKGIKDLDV